MNYYNNYGKACKQIFAQLHMRFLSPPPTSPHPEPAAYPPCLLLCLMCVECRVPPSEGIFVFWYYELNQRANLHTEHIKQNAF